MLKLRSLTAVLLALSMVLSACKADEATTTESDPAFVPAAGAVVLALGSGASLTQILGVAMAAVGLGGTIYQWQQNNVHYIALPNPTSTVLDQLLGLGAKPAPSVRIPKDAQRLSGVFWKISPEDVPHEAAASRALDKMIKGTKNKVLLSDASQNRDNGWWLVVIEQEPFSGRFGWEYRLTTHSRFDQWGKNERFSFATKQECEAERKKQLDNFKSAIKPTFEKKYPANGELIMRAWCVKLPAPPPVVPVFK